MSAENQGGAGRREVAYRLFAAEFDDADFEYSEDDDERSPNYVITPTGARVNRLFVVGVITEVESVNEDMLRARIVDPTGAFVSYAGQYQPDAQTFLERAEPPQYVSVTGKARTFEPEDGDVIYTSIRPETMNEVDAATRDRWTVQAAEQTLERISTMAGALERDERGDDLRALLEANDVESGLATGIPLAIEHYGTTTGYLDALRTLAIQAAEVVANEREEVESLDLAPDEGGDVDLPDVHVFEGEAQSAAASVAEDVTDAAAEAALAAEADAETEDTGIEPEDVMDESTAEAEEADDDNDDLGDFEPTETTTTEEPTTSADAEADDEMYELDDEEREAVKEEYGTEFSTGTEVESPDDEDDGPATADEPAAETDEEPVIDDESETAGYASTDDEAETVTEEDASADEVEADADDDTEDGTEAKAPAAEDVDLETAVVEAMGDLDEGDGANRTDVIDAVVSEYGASEDEVDDAIQEALMSGKCYEPGDDRFKPI